jgi:hypothetical protein
VFRPGRDLQREPPLLPTDPHDVLWIDLRQHPHEQRSLRRLRPGVPEREFLLQRYLLSDRHGESPGDLLSVYPPELWRSVQEPAERPSQLRLLRSRLPCEQHLLLKGQVLPERPDQL